MRSQYLVCYDIADPRRLGKVHRYLKGEALPLQYSVFLASLTWPELETMKGELARLIEATADDVRIYPLPSGDVIQAFGLGDRVPEGIAVHIP
jgi:CRISPR-associated protein Cas2